MGTAIETLWGSGSELDALQMAVRAVAMFFTLMALLRLGGTRVLGKMASFDNVVLFVLGAVASRAIVGASPFGPTVAACATIIALHRGVAWLTMRSPRLSRLFEGKRIVIVRRGEVLNDQLARVLMTREEVEESVRLTLQRGSLEGIEEAALETCGKISFVEKNAAKSA